MMEHVVGRTMARELRARVVADMFGVDIVEELAVAGIREEMLEAVQAASTLRVENEKLKGTKGTKGYWALNDAQYN